MCDNLTVEKMKEFFLDEKNDTVDPSFLLNLLSHWGLKCIPALPPGEDDSYVANEMMPVPVIVTATRLYLIEDKSYVERLQLDKIGVTPDLYRNIDRELYARELNRDLVYYKFNTRNISAIMKIPLNACQCNGRFNV